MFGRGDDEVIKVLRPGFDDRIGEQEASVAAIVDVAGIGAPRFRGTVRVDGRLGLRYERLDGPSMLDSLSRRAWAFDGYARRFAELHAVMHGTSGGDLPDQKAGMGRDPAALPPGPVTNRGRDRGLVREPPRAAPGSAQPRRATRSARQARASVRAWANSPRTWRSVVRASASAGWAVPAL